jgi:hypothetical protein
MGCDIHGFLEVKEDEKWKILKEVPGDRDYDIFGLLFGVRNYVNVRYPIAEQRGLPKYSDSEYKERKKYWGFDRFEEDSHSHTWISTDDILEYDFSHVSHDTRCTWFKDGINQKTKSGGNLKGIINQDTDERKHLWISGNEILESSYWKSFLQEMKELSNKYGNNGVRVVVWFDC